MSHHGDAEQLVRLYLVEEVCVAAPELLVHGEVDLVGGVHHVAVVQQPEEVVAVVAVVDADSDLHPVRIINKPETERAFESEVELSHCVTKHAYTVLSIVPSDCLGCGQNGIKWSPQ